jgi:hypothetical protein
MSQPMYLVYFYVVLKDPKVAFAILEPGFYFLNNSHFNKKKTKHTWLQLMFASCV